MADASDLPSEGEAQHAGERVKLPEEFMGQDVPIEDEEEVDIVMRRIKFIQGLTEKCRRLNINACLLNDMEGVKEARFLEKLELSENHLKEIKGLNELHHLTHLDLSFNEIRHADGLDNLVDQLVILRLQNNQIHKIPESVGRMSKLIELELGSNKIKKLENLPTQSLEQLWLGRNHLRDESLTLNPPLQWPKLRILSLQNNALTQFPTDLIISAPNLEELYLSENFIVDPPTDERLLALKDTLTHLDLSYNKISVIGDVLPKLTNLKELWLNNNNITDFNEIKKLKPLQKLESVYFEANPVKSEMGILYRQSILEIWPSELREVARASTFFPPSDLQQVDAVYLGNVVIKGVQKS